MVEKSYKIIEGEESIQGSAAWLKFREGKIGASQVAAILNESPFQTKLELWEEIVFKQPKTKSKAMQRGNDLEPKARAHVNGLNERFRFQPVVIQNLQYPYLMASLDGYYENEQGKPHILEIKCPGKDGHSIALSGEIPKYYFPQLQYQMEMVGVEHMLYFSYDGEEGKIILCNRDEDYCKKMMKEIYEFYQSIIDFKPPLPTSRDWVEMADPDMIVKSFRYKQLQLLIDELETEKESIRDFLIENAQHNRIVVGDLRCQNIARKGQIDYEKIIKDYEIHDAEDYRKHPVSSWRITSS